MLCCEGWSAASLVSTHEVLVALLQPVVTAKNVSRHCLTFPTDWHLTTVIDTWVKVRRLGGIISTPSQTDFLYRTLGDAFGTCRRLLGESIAVSTARTLLRASFSLPAFTRDMLPGLSSSPCSICFWREGLFFCWGSRETYCFKDESNHLPHHYSYHLVSNCLCQTLLSAWYPLSHFMLSQP